MKTETKIVTFCGECPFADDGESTDGEWTCHAKYTREGWPRHLDDSHSPKRPPRWCPLRKASVLVQLKLPRRS